MKKIAALSIMLAIAPFGVRAESPPARIDLSDCRILSGKLYPDLYQRILANYQAQAKTGDLKARKGLAAIANNKFACILEDISEGAGWTVVTSSGSKTQESGVASTRTAAPAIINNPQAVQALREAYRLAKDVADEELPYRQIAAGYVADYKEAFPKEHAEAYGLALGAQHIACRSPQLISQKANNFFCARAKAQVAALYPLLTQKQRESQEESALAWVRALQRRQATGANKRHTCQARTSRLSP